MSSHFFPEPLKVPQWPFLTGFGLLIGLGAYLILLEPAGSGPAIFLVAALSVGVGSILPAVPLAINLISRNSIRRALTARVSLDLVHAMSHADEVIERLEKLQKESNVQKIVSDHLPQIVGEKFAVVQKDVRDTLDRFETHLSTLLDSRRNEIGDQVSSLVRDFSTQLQESLSKMGDNEARRETASKENAARLARLLEELASLKKSLHTPSKEPAKASPPSGAGPATLETTAEAGSVEGSEGRKDLPDPPEKQPATTADPSPPTLAKPASTETNPAPNDRGSKKRPVDSASSKNEPQPPTSQKPASKHKPAHLVVSAFVGVSSRVFIRGNGPGLSPEEGVPLTMSGIGEWSWTHPIEEAVEFSLWLDDKKPAKNAPFQIHPGERKVVEPKF